jgi:hypothetical protein
MLRDLITSLGLKGTPAEIAAALNTKTIAVPQPGRKTWADIVAAVGPEAADYLYNALDREGYTWMRDTLAGGGLDFSQPEILDLLEKLHDIRLLSEQEYSALRQLGIKMISPYEQMAGEGQLVTEEQVTEALALIAPDGEQQILSIIVQPDGHTMATLVIQPTYQGRPCRESRVRQLVGDAAIPLRNIVQSLARE